MEGVYGDSYVLWCIPKHNTCKASLALTLYLLQRIKTTTNKTPLIGHCIHKLNRNRIMLNRIILSTLNAARHVTQQFPNSKLMPHWISDVLQVREPLLKWRTNEFCNICWVQSRQLLAVAMQCRNCNLLENPNTYYGCYSLVTYITILDEYLCVILNTTNMECKH